MKVRRLLAALASALACNAAMAAPVTELQPAQLAAFIQQHPLAVVQFTSPDRRCRYCVGADKPFDDAAAASKHPKLVFARVQWPVWYDTPKVPLVKQTVRGIPDQVLFKNGSVHRRAGGRAASASLLLAQLEDMQKQPPAPQGWDKVYPKPLPALDPEYERLARLRHRYEAFVRIVNACANTFPEQNAAYRSVFNAWTEPRDKEIDQSVKLMLAARGNPDMAEAEKTLAEQEQTKLADFQNKTLGIGSNRAAVADDCTKLVNGVAALP